jgi:anti-sigma factor (TIGR02949 family)
MAERELSCEEVVEVLCSYLHGELDGDRQAALERHLRRCRDCFSRAEFERRLRERVAATGSARVPERLRRRVRQLLREF